MEGLHAPPTPLRRLRLVVEDRKAVLLTAASLFLVDKSALAETLFHSWSAFDETNAAQGPSSTAPTSSPPSLPNSPCSSGDSVSSIKRKSVKVALYGLTPITLLATMYTFSRGAYLAVIAGVTLLAILKDRKLLIVVAVFLLTWQAIVPAAVRERITMTQDTNGQLEASAQEHIDLWTQSKRMFLSSPVVGTGFGTFQLGEHTDNLKDIHSLYVKVLAETGPFGFVIVLALLYRLTAISVRLFRQADDPLHRAHLASAFSSPSAPLSLPTSSAIAGPTSGSWAYSGPSSAAPLAPSSLCSSHPPRTHLARLISQKPAKPFSPTMSRDSRSEVCFSRLPWLLRRQNYPMIQRLPLSAPPHKQVALAGSATGQERAAAPHVLLILDGFPKAMGGGERIARRLAERLPAYGFQASILALSVHPESPVLSSPLPFPSTSCPLPAPTTSSPFVLLLN